MGEMVTGVLQNAALPDTAVVRAAVSGATSGDNTLVTAVTGKKIKVLGLVLVAAGAVNVRLESGAGGTAGDLLVLINTGAQTIHIADTGTQMLSAAWAAGQYDSLILWSDGTNWIEISRSDN